MADDPDFEPTTSSFSDVAVFLKRYQLLFQYPLKDFFKENVHSTFEMAFPEVSKMSAEELLKQMDDQKVDFPELNQFLQQKSKIMLDSPCFVQPFDEIVLPKSIFKGITAKKEQEIRYFAKLIKEYAEINNIKTIVDIGCGKVG